MSFSFSWRVSSFLSLQFMIMFDLLCFFFSFFVSLFLFPLLLLSYLYFSFDSSTFSISSCCFLLLLLFSKSYNRSRYPVSRFRVPQDWTHSWALCLHLRHNSFLLVFPLFHRFARVGCLCSSFFLFLFLSLSFSSCVFLFFLAIAFCQSFFLCAVSSSCCS